MEKKLQPFFSSKISFVIPVFGGDINHAYKVQTIQGTYFVKLNSKLSSEAMFETEARGLDLLGKIGGLKVPKVISRESFGNNHILILSWIEQLKTENRNVIDFAQQLANLHKSYNKYFGLDHNNYIGSLEQINTRNSDWLSFYYINRISAQLKIAIDSGILSKQLIKPTERMFENISKELPEIKPSLLHGDLWNGNVFYNKENKAVFFDPAIYYGDREVDIAMMKLFGGFSTELFNKYNDLYPFEFEYENRVKFYQLYYIIVHANLFKGHYINEAKNIINFYGS